MWGTKNNPAVKPYSPEERGYWSNTLMVKVVLLGLFFASSVGAQTTKSRLGTQLGTLQVASLSLLNNERRPFDRPYDVLMQEKYRTAWSVYLDNDLFSFADRDQDYTGGFTLSLSGRRAKDYWFSVDGIRRWSDRFSRFERIADHRTSLPLHSFETGVMAFTPQDISQTEPVLDDRPYSSLVFVSNLRQRVLPLENVSYQSSFTLGVLGLSVVAELQNELHEWFGGDMAYGWDHQISDGGELTARYAISRQATHWQRLAKTNKSIEVTSSLGASLGYISDVHIGLSGRWGRIRSPWWTVNPQLTDYRSRTEATVINNFGESQHRNEFYVWAGANLSLNFYNAFLQGQFRHSEVRFSRSELNSVVMDAWLGVTRQLKNGFRISIHLRVRSPELKINENRRAPVWGGLIFSYAVS